MPRNLFGGKKHKRTKNKQPEIQKKAFTEKASENQTYAKVIKGTGDRGLLVECEDGKQRRAVIPGKFRKRVWIRKDDIILVTIDAFGNGREDTCLVEHKYNAYEIRDLQMNNLISFKDSYITNNEDDDNKEIYEKKDISQRYLFPPSSSSEEDEFITDDEDSDIDDKYNSDESIDLEDL